MTDSSLNTLKFNFKNKVYSFKELKKHLPFFEETKSNVNFLFETSSVQGVKKITLVLKMLKTSLEDKLIFDIFSYQDSSRKISDKFYIREAQKEVFYPILKAAKEDIINDGKIAFHLLTPRLESLSYMEKVFLFCESIDEGITLEKLCTVEENLPFGYFRKSDKMGVGYENRPISVFLNPENKKELLYHTPAFNTFFFEMEKEPESIDKEIFPYFFFMNENFNELKFKKINGDYYYCLSYDYEEIGFFSIFDFNHSVSEKWELACTFFHKKTNVFNNKDKFLKDSYSLSDIHHLTGSDNFSLFQEEMLDDLTLETVPFKHKNLEVFSERLFENTLNDTFNEGDAIYYNNGSTVLEGFIKKELVPNDWFLVQAQSSRGMALLNVKSISLEHRTVVEEKTDKFILFYSNMNDAFFYGDAFKFEGDFDISKRYQDISFSFNAEFNLDVFPDLMGVSEVQRILKAQGYESLKKDGFKIPLSFDLESYYDDVYVLDQVIVSKFRPFLNQLNEEGMRVLEKLAYHPKYQSFNSQHSIAHTLRSFHRRSTWAFLSAPVQYLLTIKTEDELIQLFLDDYEDIRNSFFFNFFTFVDKLIKKEMLQF